MMGDTDEEFAPKELALFYKLVASEIGQELAEKWDETIYARFRAGRSVEETAQAIRRLETLLNDY